jgi:signal transduction histidine kinase
VSQKAQIVSSLERARGDLNQALADLEKLPAFDPGSVAFVAHALNNFLTVTRGTVDLLRVSLGGSEDPQVHIWLDGLHHATTLMSHTVNQLMNNSVAHEPRLRFEKVDLRLLCERACGFYQTLADRKQIKVVSTAPNDVPEVWTDRVAIAAVLDNLLSNAVKYSPAGSSIEVTVLSDESGIVCQVQDQGPGLSPQEMTKLFQPGVRLSPLPTGGEPSTGYGLAVAKRLMDHLGGEIWCESTPGKGARFSFRLPAYEDRVHGPR